MATTTETITLNANGTFHFTTPMPAGAAYDVNVLTQPVGQTCARTNDAGTMGTANVTNVGAVCTNTVAPVRRFSPGIYVALSYQNGGLGPSAQTLSADTGTFSYAAGTTAAPLTITGNYSDGGIPGGKNGTGTSTGCSQGSGTGGHTLARRLSTGITKITGPAVDIDSTHRVVGVVPRYPWADLEVSLSVTFTASVGGAVVGTLTAPIANGTYRMRFSNGNIRVCTVTTGTHVTWTTALTAGSVTTAFAYDQFNFTKMDADLAQCIALNIMWVPMFVFKTFTAAECTGTPIPTYMQPYTYVSGTNILVWVWDQTNVVPNTARVLAAIAARYDLCPNFGGIATQETANFSADTAANNWTNGDYLKALQSNSDAISIASPNSRHWAFNNFGGNGPVMIDKYAAYVQKNGGVLAMPDTTLCSNGVYGSCYTSGTGTQAGRYSGFRFGGTIGSGIAFASTGPVAGSIQRAEWIGIAPGCLAANGGQSVQRSLNYLLGSTLAADGLQPNFLNGQAMVKLDR